MKNTHTRSLLRLLATRCSLLATASALALAQPFSLSALSQRASADDPLATLRKEHPRLIVTAQEWADFDARVRNRAADPLFDSLLSEIENEARDLLTKPPLERELIGYRLLGVSQRMVERVLTLGVAHRATGDDAFFHRAEKEMLAVADFKDWNPSHFLDTAEMTAALAIGYDWFYDKLSPETRAVIRRAIIEKGLRKGMDPNAGSNWWHRRENNWNQICFGNLSLGALAIAEDEPELARDMLNLARAGIVHGLKPYMPDGIYPEGPAYWTYGTSYQALLNATLESALGTDWNLNASPGFLASACVQFQLRGPSGGTFGFSDGLKNNAYFSPVMFWFAKKTGIPALAIPPVPTDKGGRWYERNIHAPRSTPLCALWWPRDGLASKPPAPALPLAWKGGGQNPVAVFRTSWTDPDALWLACKAGIASAPHGHMDAGSFALEADGVRWADDLGGQVYNTMESKGMSIFGRTQDAQRWTVFRYNNFSHNTLTIDNQLHRVDGRADFVEFRDGSDAKTPGAMIDGELTAGATMDLSPVFAGQASKVRREFTFFPKSRKVWIADTIEGAKPGAEIRWAMVTNAQVRISKNGDSAELSQNGKTLTASLIPVPGEEKPRFEIIPAAPAVKNDYDAENPDMRILIARAKAPKTGPARILVELRPPAKN